MNRNQIVCNHVVGVFTVKETTRFVYSQVTFLFTLFFALSTSVVARTTNNNDTINYNDSMNWMCHPFLKTTDVARNQDLNVYIINKNCEIDSIDTPKPVIDPLVDIFYVYPTIDMTYKWGNTKIDSIEIRDKAQFIYREQAGIYARFGRVYAPYYRQAKIGVFVLPLDLSTYDDSLRKLQADCMEKAFNDVDAAFTHYLKYYNNGRKIILIGHSQGADLMRFLLRKRFDNNPALRSQLVVALSGGEPNYAANGSRTGGSLENIKTLYSDSTHTLLESGCMISWRTWKSGTTGDDKPASLSIVSFFYNQNFVDKGLIYQIYDTSKHQESNYNFSYIPKKSITRYITLSPDKTTYWGFDDMFTAQFVSKNEPGNTYLMIDSIPNPNDKRKIPNTDSNDILFPAIPIPTTINFFRKESNNVNYHCWDMQFVQGDLLKLLPQLIAITHPVTSIPKVTDFENTTLIYPNPTNGIVHVNNDQQAIKSIKLYNSQGVYVEEFFTNNFSIANLASGIYYIVSQTNKSTFANNVIKK